MQKVINGHEDETGICAVEETLDETHEEALPTHPLEPRQVLLKKLDMCTLDGVSMP